MTAQQQLRLRLQKMKVECTEHGCTVDVVGSGCEEEADDVLLRSATQHLQRRAPYMPSDASLIRCECCTHRVAPAVAQKQAGNVRAREQDGDEARARDERSEQGEVGQPIHAQGDMRHFLVACRRAGDLTERAVLGDRVRRLAFEHQQALAGEIGQGVDPCWHSNGRRHAESQQQ